MSEKALFVDDEPNVLDAIRRQLRKRFDVTIAAGGEEGLKKLREEGPFAVVVSDQKMPVMSGVEFLSRVKEESPDTVRMMLTGETELQAAIAAVNEGNVFRFLTKPCDSEILIGKVEAAIAQHRLIIAERELLEQTLSGAVKVLTEILGLVNPMSFSRSARVRQYAEHIAESFGLEDQWQISIAAMLSQIGCITIPNEVLLKQETGDELSDQETQMFQAHPGVAAELIAKIPRLEGVARMISAQRENIDHESLPADPREWRPEFLGGQILRICLEFDHLITHGFSRPNAMQEIKQARNSYPSCLVSALESVELAESHQVIKSVGVAELSTLMILDEDVMGENGMFLAPKGQEVTKTVLTRLRNFAQGTGIKEPFRVIVKQ